MQRRVKTIGLKCGWTGGTGKEMKEQNKKVSKTIDVSSALEVSVNGVTCVLVVHFQSSDTF